MKILKWILIVVVIIIAIPLITALFTKKDYHIEREIVINKPEQQVFDYIKLIRNQNYYSKWNMKDPNAKMQYSGTDGTVGFVSSWDSQDKEVGKGEQTITLIARIGNADKVGTDLHFIKPFDGRATAYMQAEPTMDNQTKVKWGIDGHMAYPMNFMMVIMDMDKMMGADLATNLTNLKGILEK